MKRNENKEKLILQLKQTKNICNDMSEVVDNFENLTYEEINDRYLKMVALYEKGCLKMRKFPSYLGNPNAMKEVQEIIDEVMNVEVGYTEQGWFCVRMPFLLPKKESDTVLFLCKPNTTSEIFFSFTTLQIPLEIFKS